MLLLTKLLTRTAAKDLMVAPGNAATAGDKINIYCTGLGALLSDVAAGDNGPHASTTVTAVSVTIGGKAAEVRFNGLTPGMVGFYSVEAIIPNDLAPGDRVPVTLTSMTNPPAVSPEVTMAIQ